MSIESRYEDGTHLRENPDWFRGDAGWKAGHVIGLLDDHRIEPASICDVGCGTGEFLARLRSRFESARLCGYDISPELGPFWASHPGVEFKVGDFHMLDTERHDLLTMIDVFEHVRDPFTFLERSRAHGKHFVFHIPLDLSALSVCRRSPLMATRHKVGHLHFYTRDLALETLRECGYTIIESRYTGAYSLAQSSRLAAVPRRIAYAINKDWGVRLLGGETLMVLATC